jgi:hexosaminidase
VLGGQACQWSEGINVHNFDARTWTNAAAVAERLWSPRNMSDPETASPRLIDHICRMNARGLDANPIEPSFCPMGDFAVRGR